MGLKVAQISVMDGLACRSVLPGSVAQDDNASESVKYEAVVEHRIAATCLDGVALLYTMLSLEAGLDSVFQFALNLALALFQLGYLIVDNRYFISKFLNCCHNSLNS